MRLRRLIIALLALAVLGGTGIAAEKERHPVLVLKDGRHLRVQKWEQKGVVTHVTDLNGRVTVVRTDLIDFERTRLATEVAMRPPTPTPAPTRKKSLVEAAREAQEERRRRAAASEPTPEIVTGKLPPLPAVTPPPQVPATPAPGATAAARATPTPAPTPAATETPAPEATPTPAAATPPPPPEGMSPLVLYGGAAAVLGMIAIGTLLALKRRAAAPAPAAARGKAAAAAGAKAAPAGEELLVPAFADEAPAEDLPLPVPVADESISAPAELPAGASDRRALSDGRTAPQAVLEPGREIQVRIQSDVYTCPDAETLRRWVEEGRVIENSEVLAPDGSWLLAGSIPDLEQAFERRRDTLGY